MKRSFLHKIPTPRRLRRLIGNNRTVRRFAKQHDLVYFGSVNPSDESRLVKGHTLSRTQRDRHYCVGTVLGRDMIFLQRSDAILGSTVKHKERYTWNILALDLNDRMALPHMYIEGKNRHGQAFYETFSMRHKQLVQIPPEFLHGYDPLFRDRYTCRTVLAQAIELPYVITPVIASTIAYHFSMFDFECHDDMLYVYYVSKQPSIERLHTMLRCGLWLSSELEKSYDRYGVRI